jgi:hypothetical protein
MKINKQTGGGGAGAAVLSLLRVSLFLLGRCGGGATGAGRSGPSIANVPVLRMDFLCALPGFFLFGRWVFLVGLRGVGWGGVPGAAVSSKA